MNLQDKKKWFMRTIPLLFLPVLLGLLLSLPMLMLLSIALAMAWSLAVHCFWRCPHSNSQLGPPDRKVSYCPRCGKRLEGL